jgi:hypothetical protein
MRGSHVAAIAAKQFKTLRHDRRTLGLMLVAPILAMLIFGFAFGTSPKHIPVLVVNNDSGDMAGKIVGKLDHDKLALSTTSDLGAARDQVRAGKSVAVLVFGRDFTKEASPSMEVVPPTVKGGRPTVTMAPPKGARGSVSGHHQPAAGNGGGAGASQSHPEPGGGPRR